MVYLARRAEDTDKATIAWKFDFTKDNVIIDQVSIKFETKTYENGVIDLQILNEHGKCVALSTDSPEHSNSFLFVF